MSDLTEQHTLLMWQDYQDRDNRARKAWEDILLSLG